VVGTSYHVVTTRKFSRRHERLSRANEINNQSNYTIYMNFPNKYAPTSPVRKSAIYTSYWLVEDLASLWPWFLTKLPKIIRCHLLIFLGYINYGLFFLNHLSDKDFTWRVMFIWPVTSNILMGYLLSTGNVPTQ
jgi:hypothetical protein